MGTILLIVNPVAGKLRARGALMDIVEVYSAAGLDLNLKLTQKRGHARELARGAKKEQYERVVCVGGDGTLNEVITGLIESGETIPLGYIPLGSTNDFAASMEPLPGRGAGRPGHPGGHALSPGRGRFRRIAEFLLCGFLRPFHRRSPIPPPRPPKMCWVTWPPTFWKASRTL